ncbi:MAG: SUMF1/EgtB/PvdO family nonheme iron enzyme, partial [Gemmatimonadota bacterium]|nr:SUMF1/EgtB/PvdO family nonheme iron enzyme [Gemmatimonadota bacterium]
MRAAAGGLLLVALVAGGVYWAQEQAARDQAAQDQAARVERDMDLVFVEIPAGSFTMGSPSGESGRESDEKRHRVTLTRGFSMSATEVTQAQW